MIMRLPEISIQLDQLTSVPDKRGVFTAHKAALQGIHRNKSYKEPDGKHGWNTKGYREPSAEGGQFVLTRNESKLTTSMVGPWNTPLVACRKGDDVNGVLDGTYGFDDPGLWQAMCSDVGQIISDSKSQQLYRAVIFLTREMPCPFKPGGLVPTSAVFMPVVTLKKLRNIYNRNLDPIYREQLANFLEFYAVDNPKYRDQLVFHCEFKEKWFEDHWNHHHRQQSQWQCSRHLPRGWAEQLILSNRNQEATLANTVGLRAPTLAMDPGTSSGSSGSSGGAAASASPSQARVATPPSAPQEAQTISSDSRDERRDEAPVLTRDDYHASATASSSTASSSSGASSAAPRPVDMTIEQATGNVARMDVTPVNQSAPAALQAEAVADQNLFGDAPSAGPSVASPPLQGARPKENPPPGLPKQSLIQQRNLNRFGRHSPTLEGLQGVQMLNIPPPPYNAAPPFVVRRTPLQSQPQLPPRTPLQSQPQLPQAAGSQVSPGTHHAPPLKRRCVGDELPSKAAPSKAPSYSARRSQDVRVANEGLPLRTPAGGFYRNPLNDGSPVQSSDGKPWEGLQ